MRDQIHADDRLGVLLGFLRVLRELDAARLAAAAGQDLGFDDPRALARPPERLARWLARATTSAVAAWQRFAPGLRDDYAAVKAGVTVPWSNGPVEGHINRLKMLQRQMCGRAHLDLLGHRFLRVPCKRRSEVCSLRPRIGGRARAGDAARGSQAG